MYSIHNINLHNRSKAKSLKNGQKEKINSAFKDNYFLITRNYHFVGFKSLHDARLLYNRYSFCDCPYLPAVLRKATTVMGPLIILIGLAAILLVYQLFLRKDATFNKRKYPKKDNWWLLK